KRVFLVILFTSFSGSLVSRIPGAVHLKRDIIDYINYYNQLRIKEKLGGLSPVQYRLNQAA
ncbi:IS3 family transposase, partial [Escherichia coli]|nr:IS3 family transposase [Escherichia coli]